MSNEYLNNKNFETLIQLFQQNKRKKTKYEMIIKDLEHSFSLKRNCDKLKERKTEYTEVSNNYQLYQEQLAQAFYTLSINIVRYAKFHLIDIDDAVQEGVLICFEKIDRFDPVKGRAFNYMTTCIFNHLRQLYRSARNYNELKKKYMKHLQDNVEEVIIRGKPKSYKSSIENSGIL